METSTSCTPMDWAVEAQVGWVNSRLGWLSYEIVWGDVGLGDGLDSIRILMVGWTSGKLAVK